MGKNKASFFVNLWESGDGGPHKLIRSGATRDPDQFIDAPPPTPRRTANHVTCNRCRGTKGGPNAFVPERKCRRCKGLGFVQAAA